MGNRAGKLRAVVALGAGFALTGCIGTTYKRKDAAARADAAADAGIDVGRDTRDSGPDASLDSGPTAEAIAAAQLERGEYLVKNVSDCVSCHTPGVPGHGLDMSRYLAGNPALLVLPGGARLPAPNLTPDPSGLQYRSPEEIKRMFLDGVRTTAVATEALNPIMPYHVFHNMSAPDADAIVAYLRSIPAVDNLLAGRSPELDVSAPAEYLDMSTVPAPAAGYAQAESALRGRYLATQAGRCIDCHTRRAAGRQPLDTSRFFQGGLDLSAFLGGLDIAPISANLTSDAVTGLGRWTSNDIVTALKIGKDQGGEGICPPMPVGPMAAYGGLTMADATDIANYIKWLPAAVSYIPDTCAWPAPATGSDAGNW
jgi:mono/diheme cytochrome c family protein